MPALGKVCPQCSSVEHCRRLVCVKCGYVFTKKKCMASARLCESEQESCVRRAKNKQRMASARACESEQESCVRRAKNKQRMARKRVRETEEETCERRAKNRRMMSNVRAQSNPFIAIKGAGNLCLTLFHSLYYNVGVVTAQLLISFNANNHFY